MTQAFPICSSALLSVTMTHLNSGTVHTVNTRKVHNKCHSRNGSKEVCGHILRSQWFNEIFTSKCTTFIQGSFLHCLLFNLTPFFVCMLSVSSNVIVKIVHCACLLNKEEPTFSRNTSLFVNLLTAIKESCTIPMTGLFDCGVTMFLGTIMISVISARASRDWGTCKFISSPSKSALYGVVTLK